MSDPTTLDALISQVNDASRGLGAAFVKFGMGLEEAAHNMTVKFNVPRERLERYYRQQADPDEVVQYILQQPNHTWMGVTIWPDEAWRYSGKRDWMWWRE